MTPCVDGIHVSHKRLIYVAKVTIGSFGWLSVEVRTAARLLNRHRSGIEWPHALAELFEGGRSLALLLSE